MRHVVKDICWQRIAIAAGGVLLLAARMSAKDDLPPDVLLVAHTLQANAKLLRRLPLYTCLETISRSQPITKRHRPQKQDVIELDVGVGAREEIYSWPGDPSFSPKDIFALVGHGLLANGLFQTFASDLFIGDAGIVKAAGEAVIDGRRAFHFTFSVPSLQSKWEMDWLGAQGTLAEQGEFWVDSSDLTLLRMDIAAVDIPFNLPVRSLTVTMKYRILPAGSDRVLIPESAALQAVERNGTAHQETADFSHCRVFGVEANLASSNITPEDLATAIKHYEAKREVLPPGLLFNVSLEGSINAGKAVVGDWVSAVLDGPVKTPDKDVIPKGAKLKGRIREFQTLDDPPNTVIVGLEFDELTWPGHSAAFFAGLFSLQSLPGVAEVLFNQGEQRKSVGTGALTIATTEKIRPVPIPGVASFYLQGRGASLPKGFRMTWRTQDVAHR